MTGEVTQLIEVRELRKAYGPTKALDGLTFGAARGEVLGIAGPNGAGKSTVAGVLAGEVRPDSGEITLFGRNAGDAPGIGIAVVHQEPEVFPNLTLGENLLVGRENWRLGKGRVGDEERQILDEFELLKLVDRPLEALSFAVRQRAEIMRSLLRKAEVFLFDEPNSALTEKESAQLFLEMHALAMQQKVVILVSHRLTEVAQHCDRVLVVRDGRVKVELEGDDLTAERIALEFVKDSEAANDPHRGGRLRGTAKGKPASSHSVLVVTAWRDKSQRFQAISESFDAGSIVAIMGLEGSGAREFVRSLAGFGSCTGQYMASGRVEYMTGDRQISLFSNLSVAENIAVRSTSKFATKMGWWPRRQVVDAADQARIEYGIKSSSVTQPIRALSGGNQQKVVVASVLSTEPEIAIFEEPTRGVDASARSDIAEQLREYASGGRAVVLYCTEEAEVFRCADRVLILANGRITADEAMSEFSAVEEFAEWVAKPMGGVEVT